MHYLAVHLTPVVTSFFQASSLAHIAFTISGCASARDTFARLRHSGRASATAPAATNRKKSRRVVLLLLTIFHFILMYPYVLLNRTCDIRFQAGLPHSQISLGSISYARFHYV
jgi:hypothetical protein